MNTDQPLLPETALPERTMAVLTPTTLALFAGGSGDHNPLHLDREAARQAGLGDVIGHGMLTMALMGRYITEFVPQARLRQLQTRFVEMSRLGDTIICSGRVGQREGGPSEEQVRLEVTAMRADDRQVLARGTATIALS